MTASIRTVHCTHVSSLLIAVQPYLAVLNVIAMHERHRWSRAALLMARELRVDTAMHGRLHDPHTL